jgi:hypothetical protein
MSASLDSKIKELEIQIRSKATRSKLERKNLIFEKPINFNGSTNFTNHPKINGLDIVNKSDVIYKRRHIADRGDEKILISQLHEDIKGNYENDYIGHCVALSGDGNILVVGSMLSNNNETEENENGKVSVYYNNGNQWSLIDEIRGDQYDLLGSSVAISKDGFTFAVGSVFSVNDQYSGNVKIFEIGDGINQIGETIEGELSGNGLGMSIDLSADGKIVAISSVPTFFESSLHEIVKVFQLNDDEEPVWLQIGDSIQGEQISTLSGWNISLSDTGYTVAIGSMFNNGQNEGQTIVESGHVRVYDYSENTLKWTQRGEDLDGENQGDWSGISVSLSADGLRLAIGEVNHDSDELQDNGRVRVYEWDKSSWKQLGNDIKGTVNDDNLGTKMTMSGDGNVIAVESYNGQEENNNEITLYMYEDDNWVKIGENIQNIGFNWILPLGLLMSLSNDGSKLAIGSSQYSEGGSTNIGRVRVYEIKKHSKLQTSIPLYPKIGTMFLNESNINVYDGVNWITFEQEI